MKARFSCTSKQRGLSLVESIISAGLILFVLSSSFLVINAAVKTSVTVEKKVQLTQRLDKKIDQYILTGRFNTIAIGNSDFLQVKSSNSKLIKFVGVDKDFGIRISKEVIRYGTIF
ncbi:MULTISPECIES: type II secretion system protein [Francisella]|uniref:Type II secretion system protein n=1 Tax=Francisella opportunistica TaxID=2016517 RepID=A0A345JSX4_9GAMM|nr:MULTISPECIES: type II secretion system protein [Francisella]APC92200.1 hypothetical protein BBG19_1472 [Francisella sp. MA067296]AXH30420.1 type II secretion system protein [Francisella opportunistica]AXH32060.1 hypothetical protein CGC44_07385 [Francisella opportunistica]AXH33708.1 hypothetical protein CGC45_07415 [Francisella opportunistica]